MTDSNERKSTAQAIHALGLQSFDKKDYTSAWNYFKQAADLEYTPSIINAAFVGHLVSTAAVKSLGISESRAADLIQAYSYELKAINCADVPQSKKDSLRTQIPETIYHIGVSLYFLDQIDQAKKHLETEYAKNDKRCRVLLGLCYYDIAGRTKSSNLLSRACSLMKEINIRDLDIMDEAAYVAYMSLALMYRTVGNGMSVSGITRDIKTSYEYVLKASLLKSSISKNAKTELNKYRKNLLGKWTYIG